MTTVKTLITIANALAYGMNYVDALNTAIALAGDISVEATAPTVDMYGTILIGDVWGDSLYIEFDDYDTIELIELTNGDEFD